MKTFLAFIGFCCLGFVGICIFVGVVGSQGAFSHASADISSTSLRSDKAEINHLTIGNATYPMTTVSHVAVTLMKAHAMPYVYNSYETLRPDGGKFVLISVAITNQQRDEVTMSQSLFKLVASDGTEYSASEKSFELDHDLFLKGINPGITKVGDVLFEVPTDVNINSLRLHFRGGMTGEEASLPLSEVGVSVAERSAPTTLEAPPPEAESKPSPDNPEPTIQPETEPTSPAPIVREPPPPAPVLLNKSGGPGQYQGWVQRNSVSPRALDIL